jgi:hypothetical protein
MRKFLLAGAIIAACALPALAPSEAAANLLVNGSFETGDLTGWSFTGNTGFTTVEKTPFVYGAEDGNFYVYEGPIGPDGILSQTFVDTPGQTLLISGWLAGNGTGPSDFNMSFNGVTRVSVNPVPAQGYKQYAFTATATGLDTFAVGFDNDPSFDGIDNFSVAPGIPELTTWAMMIIGFAGVGMQLRRRSRATATDA